mmetsp:Transcript_133295/g.315993  ORF Transcript_133295/g.315993 Transcript_133295/m.315993 type:complete len:221 (+) Transcript_133295:592-1254(+)
MSQSPQMQSTGLHCKQGLVLQASVTTRLLSQYLPPLLGFCSKFLWRTFCPLPQVAEQAPQGCQVLTSQSTGTPPEQWGPSGQGDVCFSGPSHHLPISLPCTAMTRLRRLMPWQGVVQPLHCCHSPKTQSTFGPQATRSLQEACSMDIPIAGLPHSLALRWMVRCRQVMPPSQVLVQASQLLQSLHSASMQAPEEQGCVLQGAISSLFTGSHARPPGEGIC